MCRPAPAGFRSFRMDSLVRNPGSDRGEHLRPRGDHPGGQRPVRRRQPRTSELGVGLVGRGGSPPRHPGRAGRLTLQLAMGRDPVCLDPDRDRCETAAAARRREGPQRVRQGRHRQCRLQRWPRTPRSRDCVPRAVVAARVVPVPARVIEHIAMSGAETWRLSAPGNPGDASVAAHPQTDASRPVGVGQVSDGAPVAARTAPHAHATAEAYGSAADDMRLSHDPLPHQRHPIDGATRTCGNNAPGRRSLASRDGRGRGGQRAM